MTHQQPLPPPSRFVTSVHDNPLRHGTPQPATLLKKRLTQVSDYGWVWVEVLLKNVSKTERGWGFT